LRRQAIAVQGISDGTQYQITNALRGKRKRSYGTHYYAMLAQVETMRKLLSTTDPWERLSHQYRSLERIVEKMSEREVEVKGQILHLYQNYVHEWDRVKHIIEREFLE